MVSIAMQFKERLVQFTMGLFQNHYTIEQIAEALDAGFESVFTMEALCKSTNFIGFTDKHILEELWATFSETALDSIEKIKTPLPYNPFGFKLGELVARGVPLYMLEANGNLKPYFKQFAAQGIDLERVLNQCKAQYLESSTSQSFSKLVTPIAVSREAYLIRNLFRAFSADLQPTRSQ